MAPSKKPTFLKTFSEFTIDELRSMPLHRVLSLFARELRTTFTEGKRNTLKKTRNSKKKVLKLIPMKQRSLPRGFIEAMKRVFVIHVSVNTPVVEKKIVKPTKSAVKVTRSVKERIKPKQEETVVFSSHPTTEENQMNGVL
jgi:hypothetical protein